MRPFCLLYTGGMEIKSTLTNHSGQVLDVIHHDMEQESDLGNRKVSGVHACCFYSDKLVIVYAANKGYWTPPGGGVEEGEDIRSSVRREVKEETNMRVIKHRFIGYQDITEPNGIVTQTRSVCQPFVSDPDGDITEIRLIDPKDYKKYIDWGEIGEHIMTRALEIKALMDAEINYVK